MLKSFFKQKNRVSGDTPYRVSGDTPTTPLIPTEGFPIYTREEGVEVVMNVNPGVSTPPPPYRRKLSLEDKTRADAAEKKLLELIQKEEEQRRDDARAKEELAEKQRVAAEAKRAAEEAERVAEEKRLAERLRKEAADRVRENEMRVAEEARRVAEEEQRAAEEERRVAALVAEQARRVEEEARRMAEEKINEQNDKIIRYFMHVNPLLFANHEPEFNPNYGVDYHKQMILYHRKQPAPFAELSEGEKVNNRNYTCWIPQYNKNGDLVMTEICHWRQYGEKKFGRYSDHINLYYKIQPGLLGNADDEALFNKLIFEEFKKKYDAEQKRQQMIEEREKAEAKRKQDIADAILKIAAARNYFIEEIEAAKAAAAEAEAAKAKDSISKIDVHRYILPPEWH